MRAEYDWGSGEWKEALMCGIEEMHYWWKILFELLLEKNVLAILHLDSVSHIIIQKLYRGTSWSISFLTFPQLCLPFCVNLPILAILHSPFSLTGIPLLLSSPWCTSQQDTQLLCFLLGSLNDFCMQMRHIGKDSCHSWSAITMEKYKVGF